MDCFLVSQLFSMARSTRCFKLGLKTGYLYASLISYARAIILSVTGGIFCVYLFHIGYRLL